jgi:hypothetical protein
LDSNRDTSEERRALQMDKAFRCAKLLQKQYWGDIVELLRVMYDKKQETRNPELWKQYEEEAGKQFKTICAKAGLGKEIGFRGKQISDPDWLWNYLRNFDATLTDTPCW